MCKKIPVLSVSAIVKNFCP